MLVLAASVDSRVESLAFRFLILVVRVDLSLVSCWIEFLVVSFCCLRSVKWVMISQFTA